MRNIDVVDQSEFLLLQDPACISEASTGTRRVHISITHVDFCAEWCRQKSTSKWTQHPLYCRCEFTKFMLLIYKQMVGDRFGIPYSLYFEHLDKIIVPLQLQARLFVQGHFGSQTGQGRPASAPPSDWRAVSSLRCIRTCFLAFVWKLLFIILASLLGKCALLWCAA